MLLSDKYGQLTINQRCPQAIPAVDVIVVLNERPCCGRVVRFVDKMQVFVVLELRLGL